MATKGNILIFRTGTTGMSAIKRNPNRQFFGKIYLRYITNILYSQNLRPVNELRPRANDIFFSRHTDLKKRPDELDGFTIC